eukprot:c12262_g1_i2.p1 GENE.c12262_g1_i2~~c12262_g1_i2.p1  ORF type:complete len:211 (+),score=47.54 c12262_g1_i2:44-676(+)
MAKQPVPDMIPDRGSRTLVLPDKKDVDLSKESYYLKHAFAIKHRPENCGFTQALEAVFGFGRYTPDQVFSGVVNRDMPQGPELLNQIRNQKQTIMFLEKQLAELTEKEHETFEQVQEIHREIMSTQHMATTARTQRSTSKNDQKKQLELAKLQNQREELNNKIVELSFVKESLEKEARSVQMRKQAALLKQEEETLTQEVQTMLNSLQNP